MWTPQERNEWISYACSTDKDRDVRRGHLFHTMTKQGTGVGSTVPMGTEDPRRSFVTNCLAKAMHGHNPIMKRLALCFYKLLMSKVNNNSFLATMQRKQLFVIVVKGSNAYKLLLRSLANDIDHSDLDIVVFISPSLDDELHTRIKNSLVIAITQTMSIYKRDLEATLFAGTDDTILHQDLCQDFKHVYMSMLKGYDGSSRTCGTTERLISAFEDDEARNICSKRSFIITNNHLCEKVVRIEIPHFDMCEFIPLKKSPLVVSHNKTITFDRDVEGLYKGRFDLIRMRLNNLCVIDTVEQSAYEDSDVHTQVSDKTDHSCDASDTNSIASASVFSKTFIVPADFIDVSIPLKGDAVLEDFWLNGGFKRCYEVYDRFVGCNVMVPNVNQCIHDLSNMLNMYNNGQVKTEKRQQRLELFKRLDDERRKNGKYHGQPHETTEDEGVTT